LRCVLWGFVFRGGGEKGFRGPAALHVMFSFVVTSLETLAWVYRGVWSGRRGRGVDGKQGTKLGRGWRLYVERA